MLYALTIVLEVSLESAKAEDLFCLPPYLPTTTYYYLHDTICPAVSTPVRHLMSSTSILHRVCAHVRDVELSFEVSVPRERER
jgi:hypothetical protein